MSEHFVNRYVIRLGHCGLGGTAYEVHAKPEDLAVLATSLLARVEEFGEGKTPMQGLMTREGIEPRPGDSIYLMSEYVTLSKMRTDRMCISFHAASSLDEDHIMEATGASVGRTWRILAKALWVIVLPVVGAVFCLHSALVLLGRMFANGTLW